MSFTNQPAGSIVNLQRGAQFVPEQWLDEIQMFRKARLLDMGVMKFFMSDVTKGDTFHIPRITELASEDKITDQPVNSQSNIDTDFVIAIDTDRVTAVAIDNIMKIVSNYELRRPYLEAMGYALAKDLFGSILGLRAGVFAGGVASNVFSSSTGTIAGNGQPMSLASFLAARTILFENDVPESDMVLMVSPRQEASLLQINQFTSIDFQNDKPLSSGKIGTLLGIPVIRTSLIGANSLTGWRNGAQGNPEPTPGAAGSRYLPKQDAFTALPLVFTGNSAPVHTAILCHKEWACGVSAKRPSVTQSFENAYQTDLMVSRQVYGSRLYRPNHAVNIHTSAT
jgi:hypothetical protein